MAALTTWLQFNVNADESQPGRLFVFVKLIFYEEGVIFHGCDAQGNLKPRNDVASLEHYETKLFLGPYSFARRIVS